jgi:AhpD family alkylhydroperoxidase
MDLLFLGTSQINGCAYCVDKHARDLRQAGEPNERLDGLAGWRESPYFTEPGRAMKKAPPAPAEIGLQNCVPDPVIASSI